MYKAPLLNTNVMDPAVCHSSEDETTRTRAKDWMSVDDSASCRDRVRQDACGALNHESNKCGNSKSLLAREWAHWCVAIVFMAAACALASFYQMGRIQAVLFVAAGACAGYFTNDLAITLLLWPTEKKFNGLLHGVFFKRRDEFGDKLIKAAREQILNDTFFADMINDEKVEIFLQETLEKEINGLLQADIGNPQTVLDKFFEDKGIQGEFVDRIAAWSGNYLSRKFVEGIDEEMICRTVKQLRSSKGGSLAEFLQGDGRHITLFIGKWVPEVINRNAASQIEKLLVYIEKEIKNSDKRLQDVFDADTRKEFETSVLNYLQTAVLSEILRKLESSAVRQQLSAFIQNEAANLAENYLHQLSGLKAWLLKVFGSSDIDLLIEEIPQMVDRVLRQFKNASENGAFNRYVTELSAQLFPKVWSWKAGEIYRQLPEGLIEKTGQYALRLIKSSEVKSRLIESISAILKDELTCSREPEQPSAMSGMDELLRYFAGQVEKLLRQDSVREGISRTVRITAREHIVGALNQPMGAMEDFPVFRSEIVKTISGKCALLVLDKIKANVNVVVQQLPVEEMLAKCWNSLTNRQIQQQVQGVLSTEFQILVNLGISFGSFVAFMLITVQNLTGALGALICLALFIPIYKFAKSRMRGKG